jgi:predicted O-methyltransferase YrrM
MIFRSFEYLKYLITSGTSHGLHSPFAFDLYTNVICDKTPFYSFHKIESIRSKMLLSNEKIAVEDFGTGGATNRKKNLSLHYIASHYVKPAKYGQLLFRLVNHFKPQHILEVGTSLGITTMYLASPNRKSRVVTLEGSEWTAEQARMNFAKAGITNIVLTIGEFSKTLPSAVKEIPNLDFVYFDGNHRKEPTLQYFETCLPYHHENSVFIFDDIYWSKGMKEAWEKIKSHPAVTLTVDLFSIGLVFFRNGIQKQHFKLRF